MIRMVLRSILAALTGLLALVFYAACIERYLVKFPRYRIPVPNLPEEFGGLRIVHVSDVHLSPLVPYWFLRMLFRRVSRIEKDIIVCTGDYVLGKDNPAGVDAVWSLLKGLRAPLGVYSVLGNCDHLADARKSMEHLEKSGQNVRGKAVPLERKGKRLWIVGAGDFLEDHLDLDQVLRTIPEGDCRIVLAHNPDTADTIFRERMDLMLAGHTHGGQVNIPFYGIPILPVQNKEYSFGLKRSRRNERVFISKGIGWGIYPVRFNCCPEIPILELVPLRPGDQG